MRDTFVRTRSQRGAAVVEFALVFSILITLVLGIISYGYMLSFRQGISQGAAEGARAAAIAPITFSSTAKQTQAVNAVNDALSSYGVTCAGSTLKKGATTVGTCSVTIATCTNNSTKQCASVALDYFYRSHPLIPSFPGLGVTLPSHLTYTSVAEVS
jgi:Flp pilus assembly protein TadG